MAVELLRLRCSPLLIHYLVDADVLLLRLYHPHALLSHLVHYAEYVDRVRVRYLKRDPIYYSRHIFNTWFSDFDISIINCRIKDVKSFSRVDRAGRVFMTHQAVNEIWRSCMVSRDSLWQWNSKGIRIRRILSSVECHKASKFDIKDQRDGRAHLC